VSTPRGIHIVQCIERVCAGPTPSIAALPGLRPATACPHDMQARGERWESGCGGIWRAAMMMTLTQMIVRRVRAGNLFVVAHACEDVEARHAACRAAMAAQHHSSYSEEKRVTV
jgi:hypothetical protein